MNLPAFAIRRHVLTATLSVLLLLMGLVAYHQLLLDRMPKIDVPVLTVVTDLRGADPQTVALSVTTPLEAQLNTISGLESMISTSGQGASNITLTFVADADMKEKLADVQSKIEMARRALPDEADSPRIFKLDLNASAIARLMLTTTDRDPFALGAAAKTVQKQLEGLAGVGEVRIYGLREETLEVALDETALAARGLTVGDVHQAIGRNHLQTAGGKARLPDRDFSLRLSFEADSPETLGEIALGVRDGQAVRLRDVATIRRLPDDTQQVARFNGVDGVAVNILKSEDANPVSVVEAVQERLPAIRKMLPGGMSLDMASEEASPIRDMVDALRDHLVEGTLLTALIIWLFLKNVRATVIVSLAIPVSLLGAIAMFQWMGYTLNSFTLLALLLLIGIVVDDAIVVLENIYRVQESEQLEPVEAARKGAQQVLFSVAAATLTLVAIFGPIMYLDGIIGQVFLPFAAVVTVGVLVSWFVAVTLTPMLCAKFLKHETHTGRVAQALERGFRAIEAAYLKSLTWSITHTRLVLALAFATLIPAGAILATIEKGFIPTQNTGRLTARIDFAAGAPIAQVEERLLRIEAAARAREEVASVLVRYREAGRSGAASASADITLKDAFIHAQPEILDALNAAFRQIDGVRAFVGAADSGAGGPAMVFNLSGPSMEVVRGASEQFLDRLRSDPVTAAIRSNMNLSAPQIALSIARDAAAVRGVSAQDVGQAIAAATGTLEAGQYTGLDGERHPIVLTLEQARAFSDTDALLGIRVRGRDGALYPLSELVEARKEGAAATITRLSQQFSVGFSGSVNGAMGDAMAIIAEAEKDLPKGVYLTYFGQAKEFQKVGKSLGLVLLAALALLYLVMASQFNDYRQPAVLMLAQPLAALGGLGALWLAGHSLNIYSMVGLILLVGLTAKTGILLVDRANQFAGEGVPPREAILKAAPERLRPILMTALTVIASLTPAAFGLGAGAENNGPLAVAVIGGMVSATALTLYVIPLAYLKMDRGGERRVQHSQ